MMGEWFVLGWRNYEGAVWIKDGGVRSPWDLALVLGFTLFCNGFIHCVKGRKFTYVLCGWRELGFILQIVSVVWIGVLCQLRVWRDISSRRLVKWCYH